MPAFNFLRRRKSPQGRSETNTAQRAVTQPPSTRASGTEEPATGAQPQSQNAHTSQESNPGRDAARLHTGRSRASLVIRSPFRQASASGEESVSRRETVKGRGFESRWRKLNNQRTSESSFDADRNRHGSQLRSDSTGRQEASTSRASRTRRVPRVPVSAPTSALPSSRSRPSRDWVPRLPSSRGSFDRGTPSSSGAVLSRRSTGSEGFSSASSAQGDSTRMLEEALETERPRQSTPRNHDRPELSAGSSFSSRDQAVALPPDSLQQTQANFPRVHGPASPSGSSDVELTPASGQSERAQGSRPFSMLPNLPFSFPRPSERRLRYLAAQSQNFPQSQMSMLLQTQPRQGHGFPPVLPFNNNNEQPVHMQGVTTYQPSGPQALARTAQGRSTSESGVGSHDGFRQPDYSSDTSSEAMTDEYGPDGHSQQHLQKHQLASLQHQQQHPLHLKQFQLMRLRKPGVDGTRQAHKTHLFDLSDDVLMRIMHFVLDPVRVASSDRIVERAYSSALPVAGTCRRLRAVFHMSLRDLELWQSARIRPMDLVHIARSTGHNLKRIVLRNCVKLDAPSLCTLAESCGSIRTLDISNVPCVNDNVLGTILENLGGSLRSLLVRSCSKLTDASLIRMSQCATSLDALDMAGLPLVTDAGMNAMLDSCGPNIVSLVISGCTLLTDKTFEAMGTHCDSLEVLCARNIPRLTNDGVEALCAGVGDKMEVLDILNCDHVMVKLFLESVAEHCPRLSSRFMDGEGRTLKQVIISSLPGFIFHVTGRDAYNGRSAVYFLLVDPGTSNSFRVSVGNEHMNLVDYGTILCSCFGDRPNDTVRDILLSEYGLDLDAEDQSPAQ